MITLETLSLKTLSRMSWISSFSASRAVSSAYVINAPFNSSIPTKIVSRCNENNLAVEHILVEHLYRSYHSVHFRLSAAICSQYAFLIHRRVFPSISDMGKYLFMLNLFKRLSINNQQQIHISLNVNALMSHISFDEYLQSEVSSIKSYPGYRSDIGCKVR